MNPTKKEKCFIITDHSIKGLTPGDILICMEVASNGDVIINDKQYKIIEKHLISGFL